MSKTWIIFITRLMLIFFIGLFVSCLAMKPELPEEDLPVAAAEIPDSDNELIDEVVVILPPVTEEDSFLEKKEIPSSVESEVEIEEILIPELSENEINRQIITLSGSKFYPVHKNGQRRT